MTLPEETLGAYVDGELDARTRAEVDAAVASDPEVAQRIQRLQALRNELLAAFSGAAQEPVPQRLLDTLRAAPRAEVANLAQARQNRRAARLRWTWPEWSALAASIAIATVLGYFLLRSPDANLFSRQQGQLLASGALADTLSKQLASEQARDAALRVGISFRSRGGGYCRTFAVQQGRNLAGLACRQGEEWRVHALARGEEASGGSAEPAGSALPPAVLQAVEREIVGETLDAAQESAARQSNWRTH